MNEEHAIAADVDTDDLPPVAEPFRGDHPIIVEGLKNSFGEHVIHENLSLTVNRGEIIAWSVARAPASRC